MGYRYDAPTQLYKLDDATRLSATFDDKTAKIGCDLILALEDLDLYVEMLKIGPIDPIVHFSSPVQQLQQNYQPAELQYPPNPIVPPCLPHQPNYPGEPFREEMQNTYTNMPERSQQPQGNARWNNPEPTRPDASMVNDQYSGIPPRVLRLPSSNMDHFLRSFRSIRKNSTLAASSFKGFPEELHQMAKELVKTNQHKYSILKIPEIIIINLQKAKTIQNIREGLFSISSYPLCLYLDQDRPEFHQIRVSYKV